MRLTITNQKIRFRVSADELLVLSGGDRVDAALQLGGREFSGCILPYDGEGEMRAELAAGGITLHVSQAALQALHDLGRSKDGITAHQDQVTVSLQLDLKTAMRLAG